MFATLFTCVYLNSRSENQWTLRRGAATISRIVNGIIEQNLRDVTFRNSKVNTELPYLYAYTERYSEPNQQDIQHCKRHCMADPSKAMRWIYEQFIRIWSANA